MIAPFAFARTPRILFGAGKAAGLPKLLRGFGGAALLVTGHGSYKTAQWDRLMADLGRDGTRHVHVTLRGEPSPDFVDEVVRQFQAEDIGVVVAWGGGSVVDAGKAISAMLPRGESVLDYLESVGARNLPDGRKTPFVAVPTTAGTGSEATKNAVLSRIGTGGFKKSLRHDDFVPDIAVIDPELALHCPPEVTAACGMDAFTQLLEAYVSPIASPLSDALAWSGLECVARSLLPVCGEGAEDLAAREDMAYAALMSGIVLANAGLGIVHGLASPIGGRFAIPHGVVCGTLMAAATAANIARLEAEYGEAHPALKKYARVGALLGHPPYPPVHGGVGLDDRSIPARHGGVGLDDRSIPARHGGVGIDDRSIPARHGGVGRGALLLIERLTEWTEALRIPRLGAYGIAAADLPCIAAQAENKNNPVPLSSEEILRILEKRI